MQTLKIAIIGAGGTGSAAARCLAQEGHVVTVFERFTLDHDHGSSYGGSRMIRRTYPDALYTRMMATAYDLWAELEAEAGEELFVRCSGLTFGRQGNSAMAQTEESLRVNGVAYKRLSVSEIAERFPSYLLDADQYGISQSDSGYLRASRCVLAQMRIAREAGARLIENVKVETLQRRSDKSVTLAWSGGEEAFDQVLVTAGPWMADLLPSLNLPLTVTRQYYAHLQANSLEAFAVGRFPVWIDLDTKFYGFPQQSDLPGVKLARHMPGRVEDPDRVFREQEPTDRATLIDYAVRRLPALHGPPVYEKTCLYTNTPDEDFLVDAVPGLLGVFFCSSCSGHGFKFTVLLGQILCNLVTGKPVSHDLTRFPLARFRQ